MVEVCDAHGGGVQYGAGRELGYDLHLWLYSAPFRHYEGLDSEWPAPECFDGERIGYRRDEHGLHQRDR